MILDLNLPGMDGLGMCREVRCQSDIPILMLTTRVDEVDKLKFTNITSFYDFGWFFPLPRDN
jgi:DNA-binding response OmpR family regulator